MPPTHRFLPRTALALSSSFYHPLAKIPAARSRGRRRLRPLGLVVPSERLCATLQPRRDEQRAPWTLEGRADRSSAPAGSCHRAVGGGAAPGACAARAARACLWERTSTPREDPAQHDRPAPPVRRVALRADRRAVRWRWPCAAAHSRARCRLRAERVARVEHAETAWVRPWVAPHRPTTPGSRVAFRADRRAVRSSWALPCGEGTLLTEPHLGQNCNR